MAAQRLLVQRKEHILQKEYLAVVDGYLPQDSPDSWHTISFPVKKVSDHPLRMQAVLNPDANCTADASLLLPALTHYCTIYSTVNWSLISLRLDTGRTHQIAYIIKKKRRLHLYCLHSLALLFMPGK